MDDWLAKLDDPGEFTVRRAVPVFGPHTKVVDGVPKTVTDAELNEWAEAGREIERLNGVAGILRVGHIRPHLPDAHPDQPPTAGVFLNMRVGMVRGKRRVVVDEYIRREWAHRIPDLPHRSVEMYRPTRRITAVALLARDPQLHDLGPPNLYHHAGPHGLELYALGADMDPTTPPPDATATPAADPNALTPDEQAFLDKLIPLLIPKLVEAMKAGGGDPAAPPSPPEPMGKTDTPEFYALQTEFHRQKAENDRLAASVQAIRVGIAQEKAKATLRDLQAEHYAFDPAAELAAMTATDDAGRSKRAADIRRFHGKVPAEGQMIELFAGHVEGGSPKRTELTRDEMNKITIHCAETGKPYNAVRSAVLAGTLTL